MLIDRILKIQNKAGNLAWYSAKQTESLPTVNEKFDEQYLVLCRHSYYRTIKYMIIEVDNDNYRIILESDPHRFKEIYVSGSEDECIKKIPELLTKWFPSNIKESKTEE